MTITCDFCGRTVEADTLPLTWSTAVEGRRLRRFCGNCSRDNVRAMEGKLDSEHW